MPGDPWAAKSAEYWRHGERGRATGLKKVECWEKLREGKYCVSGIGLSIFWAGTRVSHESTSGDTLVGGVRVVLEICTVGIFQQEM